MGSAFSRKQRNAQREVNEANMRVISFGCYGMCSGGSAFDSSEMLTAPESLVSFNNKGSGRIVVHWTDKKLPDEIIKRDGSVSVERYFSVEEELQVENMLFSSLGYSRSLLNPPISRTVSNSSFETYESFEPTPLTQVLSQLYLGTEQDAQQAEKLIGLGITHIISIVGSGRYENLYPKHMYIPLRDNGSSNLLEKLDISYDFTTESQESGNKLFVHCQLGQNRSASFVIGFLMKFRNLSLYEAYAFLKEKRELIHPHKKYLEQLRQLDLELHKVYSTPRNFLDIALCSKEEIKIMHHNFSKADSKKYMRTQMPNWNEDDDSLGSQSILRVRNGDDAELVAIYLPD